MKILAKIFLVSALIGQAVAEVADIRPEACLRMVNGRQKESKCTDYSKAGSKNGICFYKSGIWNYGTYNASKNTYTVKAVCDAGIKTRIVPSANDLQAKGSTILGILKGETPVSLSLNELLDNTFGTTASVGNKSDYKSSADVALWNKRKALAVFEGMTGISASLFPMNRKDLTPEQMAQIDEWLKSDVKKFANCVTVDDLGITKAVSACSAPKLSYDKKHNLVVSFPAGTCYPHFQEFMKVKTHWWVRKTSSSFSLCTGGLQVKTVTEGQEVEE